MPPREAVFAPQPCGIIDARPQDAAHRILCLDLYNMTGDDYTILVTVGPLHEFPTGSIRSRRKFADGINIDRRRAVSATTAAFRGAEPMARSTAAPQECAHATGAARTAGALSRPDTRSDTEAAGRPASEARGNGFH